MKEFLKRWIISTVAVLVATLVVPGITCDDWLTLVLATLVLGILNTFVRPVLMILALPLLIFTLGLFMIVINAGLLYLVGWLFEEFKVTSFTTALLGAVVISLMTMALNFLTGSGNTRIEVRRGTRLRRRNPRNGGRDQGGDGGGPVIDV